MSENTSIKKSADVSTDSPSLECIELKAKIDSSLSGTLKFSLFTSVLFLITGIFFSLICSIKLQFPGFLAFLTYGRLVPASDFLILHGWCYHVMMAVSLWQLSRISIQRPVLPFAWQFGYVLTSGSVLVGTLLILLGYQRPFAGMEYTAAIGVIFLLGFALCALWSVTLFRGKSYVQSIAHIMLLAGLFWFFCSYTLGNVLLSCTHLGGVLESLVAGWTVKNMTWVFLGSMALGGCHFLSCKASGNDLFSGSMSRIAFWLYLILAGMSNTSINLAGPLPVWIQSVSSGSKIIILAPVLYFIYNIFKTTEGEKLQNGSPAIIFCRFGISMLGAAALFNALSGFRFMGYAADLSMFPIGISNLMLLGFVSSIAFAAIYYIMPRLTNHEWLFSGLMKIHYLMFAYGVALAGAMAIFAGIFAGEDVTNPVISFAQAMHSAAFFFCGRTLAFLMIGFSLAAFLLNFLLMLLNIGSPAGEPTMMKGHSH